MTGSPSGTPRQNGLAVIRVPSRLKMALEAKKGKAYHGQTAYPVHVVVYEYGHVICEGKKANALHRANEHKGSFAGVWYLAGRKLITPL
jgi:hypothetical protein